MRNHRFIRILGLLAVLFIALAASAQIVPRPTAVENDNFASARPLILGSTVKLFDPAAATEEPDDPLACSTTPNNSVWFTFTPAAVGVLFLSTAGTRLIHPNQGVTDTRLAVYTGPAIDNLTQVACPNSPGGYDSELQFLFEPGDTYHIMLTTIFDAEYASKSFYKLTSRVLFLDLGPNNTEFEAEFSAGDWTVKNGTDDDRVCFQLVYTAYSGFCAFKFTGGAGEASKLVQTVDIPAGYRLRKNGTINIFMVYRGMDALTIGNAKIIGKLTYANGTPPGKIVINLSGLAESNFYTFVHGFAFLAHGSLTKVKLKVSHKSTAGVLMLDSFHVNYSAGAITRESGGVLPAPTAAKSKSF